MESIKELSEQKGKLAKQMRDLLNKCNGQLSSEQQSAWDALNNDIDAIDAKITAKQRHDDAVNKLGQIETDIQRINPRQVTSSDPTLSGKGSQDVVYQLGGREIRLSPSHREYALAGDSYKAEFARYVGTGNGEKLASMYVGQDSKGGYFAPMSFVAALIKFLDSSVFMRQISTVLPPMMGAVNIGVPTWDTDPSDPSWTAEVPTSDISADSTVAVGRREMMPHLLTKLITFSSKLMRSSGINLESLLIERLGYIFATTEENAFLNGSGSNQPLGVFTADTNGISTSRDITANATTSFNADDLINVLFNVKEAYQKSGVWVMHRSAVKMARKLKDGNGQYLWAPGLGGTPNTILDRPLYMSEFAPSTFTTGLYVAIFGDFKVGYWIVDSLLLEIQRLVELLSLKNKIGIKGMKETDGQPVLAEAFSRLILA